MELRNARHTDNLKKIEEFYKGIIGLDVLFSFEDHNGYSGLFLGKENHPWHLEFTTSAHKANHSFDREDILVFYPDNKDEYEGIVEQIEQNHLKKVEPANPYWKENGIMIQDPDGFGVIVSHLKVK